MSYKSNDSNEIQKVVTPKIPGNYSNGFTIAFFHEYFTTLSNISANEFKKIMIDGLKLLKINITKEPIIMLLTVTTVVPRKINLLNVHSLI